MKRGSRTVYLTVKGYEMIGLKIIPLRHYPWYQDRERDATQSRGRAHNTGDREEHEV